LNTITHYCATLLFCVYNYNGMIQVLGWKLRVVTGQTWTCLAINCRYSRMQSSTVRTLTWNTEYYDQCFDILIADICSVLHVYRGGSPTAVQACPLWELSPSHPILL